MLKKYIYLFLQRFLLHKYISIPQLYLVLLSRDLKDQKVGVGPHPLNKTKISGVESEILIKYKRIKWTPVGKTLSLFPSQGEKYGTIQYKVNDD